MSKILSILVLVALLLGAFLLIRQTKNSYELLPVNENAPLNEWNKDLAHNFQDWHEFTPPSADFKVLMPALPQHATDKIVDPSTNQPRKYDMYAAADTEGRAFMITAITLPDPVKKGEEQTLLTNAVNDMVSRSKDNKLKNMQAGNLREFSTLDFTVENGEVTVSGKALIHGNTLYILSMIDKSDQFHDKVLNFFVNSFDLEDIPAAKKQIPLEKQPAAKESTKQLPSEKVPVPAGKTNATHQ